MARNSNIPRKPSKPDADADVLVFRASLAPKLYRDFEIGAGSSLYDLALAIVTAFDFDFDHAFGFYSNLKRSIYDSPVAYELFFDMGEGTGKAQSVKRTRAADGFAKIGHKMRFLFDYGDEWVFLVELKKVMQGQYSAPGDRWKAGGGSPLR